MHVQTLVTQAPIKRVNEGIFHGFARPNQVERHTPPIGPILQGSRLEFRPMIDGDGPRAPALAQDTIKHLVYRPLVMRNLASRIGLCRLQLSTTVKIRTGRPSARGSWTTSMRQRSIGPVGIGAGPRGKARGFRRRTRRRSCYPSKRDKRSTRLRFTNQPSRRSNTQIR